MALTGRIIASIYRIGQSDARTGTGALATQGVSNSFPSAQCLIYTAPIGTTGSGVTMNAVIELLPTGLNQQSKKYYTADTVATLQTNGN